ncbi:glycosyltransferase family 39 protein [Herbivorax sp. ANBcel31]|uniref:glycosyltransferase 87 family protein n=1 Tax=Herbivorax sp. ANBcel31 TaxID=3069754 RepID=UPI0027B127F8|nr:glycosyltransferase family 39 protein [Herbivorax sp. ANBcel31]MDQ2086085.1 glycosyltransferase family 39 protein [Herbivorax sp. ANBcel31]
MEFIRSSGISFMYFYALVFFIVGLFLFMAIKKGALKVHPDNTKVHLFALLTIGFILRLILAPVIEGFSSDISCFQSWAQHAANDLPNIYNLDIFMDYPPFYLYILAIIGKVVDIFNIDYGSSAHMLLIKLPSIIADVVTAYIIFKLAYKELKPEFSLLLSGLFLFNPAILINSTLWGQVDSFFMLMVIIFLMFIKAEKKPEATAALAAATLMKPHGVFFIPILIYELCIELFRRKNIKNFLMSVVYGLITCIVILLPFSFTQHPLWIFDLFLETSEGYKHASLNAFNFFALLGQNLTKDTETFFIFSYNIWGHIFFGIICFVITPFFYFKSKSSNVLYLASLIQTIGIFVFWSRMHERYMYPAVALALIAFIYIKDIRLMGIFALSSLTIFVNCQIVLERMMAIGNPHIPPDNTILLIVSFLNVMLFAFLLWTSIDIVLRNKLIFADLKFNKNNKSSKKIKRNKKR